MATDDRPSDLRRGAASTNSADHPKLIPSAHSDTSESQSADFERRSLGASNGVSMGTTTNTDALQTPVVSGFDAIGEIKTIKNCFTSNSVQQQKFVLRWSPSCEFCVVCGDCLSWRWLRVQKGQKNKSFCN